MQGCRRILSLTGTGTRVLDLLGGDAEEMVALDVNRVQNFLLELKIAAIARLDRTASTYVAAFSERGAATFIANLETSLHLHRGGDHDLPVTVNDGAAGTTGFKRNRGASAEREFTAYYLRQLPRTRRGPFAALGAIANRVGMPLLLKYNL